MLGLSGSGFGSAPEFGLHHWYVFDFIYDLGVEYLRFAICVGIAALLVLALLSFKLINSWKKFDLDKELAASSLVPFVLLNLIPIAAVAVATWYGHNFGWGLLRFTQYSLRRFASWL